MPTIISQLFYNHLSYNQESAHFAKMHYLPVSVGQKYLKVKASVARCCDLSQKVVLFVFGSRFLKPLCAKRKVLRF